MNDVFSDVFALTYEPVSNLLVGRWMANVPDRSLLPPQEELLTAALHHNRCRFWLLDMRAQQAYSPLLLEWLGGLLAQQVVSVLSSPVFMACVADESHRTEIESIGTETLLRQQAEHEFYPYFFSDEAAARLWLADSQDHAHRPPRQ
ncbi:hypothetical protein Q5H92_01175 [Hymenobacter sp. M29]|uniref:STAS/SEC14 domain-containing protein n=1 Tax=Hymenobacter mellowenesis TaxID=3063995 RepID=A0ABT9A696_9BACT|nr:hypothetical protein [Hymenobacter sp. M29]MDO7844952.1 hypothetical protein [Hymenobacter sp. M29]